MENESKELLVKTEKSKVRFDELTDLISRPEIIADNKEWKNTRTYFYIFDSSSDTRSLIRSSLS